MDYRTQQHYDKTRHISKSFARPHLLFLSVITLHPCYEYSLAREPPRSGAPRASLTMSRIHEPHPPAATSLMGSS
jgi:hypothetical protein